MDHEQMCVLFGQPGRFTREQLNAVRESMPAVASGAKSGIHAGIREVRLQVELLDTLIDLRAAIEAMNASSTALVSTTNRLTWAILGLTGIGVIVGILALVK